MIIEKFILLDNIDEHPYAREDMSMQLSVLCHM